MMNSSHGMNSMPGAASMAGTSSPRQPRRAFPFAGWEGSGGEDTRSGRRFNQRVFQPAVEILADDRVVHLAGNFYLGAELRYLAIR
jgi:hypothetical protein